MTQQNFTVDTGLTVTGSGGNITGATNIEATGNITANTFQGNQANVDLIAGSNTWTFDTAGVLNVPGEGVIRSTDDTVTLLSFNTSTGNANSVYLGSAGGLGFSDQAVTAGNWLEIFRNGEDPEIRAPLGNLLLVAASGASGGAGKDVIITAGAADQLDYYTTAGGNVNIVGGRGASNDGGGGGPGGDVNLIAGVSADPAGVCGNITINSESYTWNFDNTGNLTLAGNLIIPSGVRITGAAVASPAPNISGFDSISAITLSASGNIIGGNILTDNYYYANGTPFTGGGGSSYGNSNVATFLAAFGSNAISTTGNITAGYGLYSGTFDESQASTAGLYVGYAGGTPRIMLGTGNTNQTLEIDNDGGTLRFYKPGTTLASLTNAGVFSVAGSVTGGNILTAGLISATGNITVAGNATVSGTSSNIVRRAFGLVAADTYVTLDDLSANVSSGSSQLGLFTSGSWQGTGWTETFTSGTPAVQQWVNLPLSSGYGSASGAMNSQGNGCRCVISDQTPTAKVYEITAVRSGTTGALWNISIERLV